MAACITVPGFDVINRAGRAGWQGSGQAERQAGAVNGISSTALVKLKGASSCLFHTKRQLTPQLMSIDIDCQIGSAFRSRSFYLIEPPMQIQFKSSSVSEVQLGSPVANNSRGQILFDDSVTTC